jgi:hypothetical protein
MTNDVADHDTAHHDPSDTAAEQDTTLARLQDQVEALTGTVAEHQRLFEAMFASGLLPPDVN